MQVCTEALKYNPSSVAALLGRAKARSAMIALSPTDTLQCYELSEEFEKSLDDLKQALQHDGENQKVS